MKFGYNWPNDFRGDVLLFYVHGKHLRSCWDGPRRCLSRKENPQKLTQLSSRSHPRHPAGKRTTQKDITIDTTSDSQVAETVIL